MPGNACWKRTSRRAALALTLWAAVVLPAFTRKAGRALLALAVAGSVAVVGYLPSTITASPGAEPAPERSSHTVSLPSTALASAEATVSLMGDCTSCHVVGPESVSVKPFPQIPHRTEGWEQCSFCHAPARLAPPPESHTGLPDALCRACHQVSQTSPPSLGHALWRDKTCSSCHGASLELPVSHDDRGELTCALCHDPPKVEPPSVPHTVRTDGPCGGCHTQDEMTTVEPRHMDWGDDEEKCTTCHAVVPGGVPTVPHFLATRTECSFCHLAAPPREKPGLQVD